MHLGLLCVIHCCICIHLKKPSSSVAIRVHFSLHMHCRYPGMRQDCSRAALELQAILANALSGTYAVPPNSSPPTRTPNPMCRNFTATDCVEASICPEFVLEVTPKHLGADSRARRSPPASCSIGRPLSAARPASALDLPVMHRSENQVA